MKGILSILGLFLPHFFAAALSRRKATDRRVLKYFLPYGYMKKRMKYVFHANVGNGNKDVGFVGLLRWMCPYGIVLWWDGGCDAPQVASCESPCTPGVDAVELKSLRRLVESLRREVVDGTERLELLMLRSMDTGGGRAVS